MSQLRRRLCRILMILGAFSALAGCAVGPDFKRPEAPGAAGYLGRPLRDPTAQVGDGGQKAQHFVEGLDIPAQWWALFHSAELNSLIERSLEANPDLKAAQDALLSAREYVAAQAGYFYPSVTGSFAATRQRTPGTLSPATNSGAFIYSLYTPQVSVSYAPDVFGLNRRTMESLDAQAEQQRFAVEATYLTLTSNVVATAVQEASLRSQVTATEKLVEINAQMLGILRAQFDTGYASRMDLAAQEAQYAQVAATLPPLRKQLAQERDLLSDLAGRFPSQGLPETFELSSLELPESLPVSLPSRLVEQRPDVLQAEENLRSANAQVGVARANRFPNFTLTGTYGSSALAISQVFSEGTGFWGLGAGVAVPVFEGGTLLHRERAAKDAYQQAGEQYRSTVLSAFESVADTLHAIEEDGAALKAAQEGTLAAKISLELATSQLHDGYISELSYLVAEQNYQQALVYLAQARANSLGDTASLFQALGGGWWNRSKTSAPPNRGP
jgi:NodT family efflux transporter outer membrane factor (OMF) lipoprotein